MKNLPWRNEKDPYRILIAEVMLQRTKVEQVLPVYEKFIIRFPNFESLARSSEPEIRKFMNRLGLYWRTKLILKMAKKIIRDFNGKLPSEREMLFTIPGIGDYIAEMIIILAFRGKGIAIDSNVVRLITRFFGIETKGELRRRKNFINFCQELNRRMSSDEVRNFNLAIIDFPSMICKPKPLCNVCPLASRCIYFNDMMNLHE